MSDSRYLKPSALSEVSGIAVGRYHERIRQAEAMGEFGLSETLRGIIVQEQEHEINLAAALGINAPRS